MRDKAVATLSFEQYLDFENESSTKHEYVAGQVYAMSGATLNHQQLALRLGAKLLEHTAGSGCFAVTEMKLHAKASDAVYYPDVLVQCSPVAGSTLLISEPVLIIEVLSKSTEQIDRREKLAAYQRIESLQEYVLVNQWRPRIEIWRRDTDGAWDHSVLTKADKLVLAATTAAGELTLNVSDLYADLDLPAGGLEVHEEEVDAYGNWS